MLTAVAMLWQLRRLRVGPGGCGARALAWHGRHAGGHSASFEQTELQTAVRCTHTLHNPHTRAHHTPSAPAETDGCQQSAAAVGKALSEAISTRLEQHLALADSRLEDCEPAREHGSSRKHSRHKESTKRTGGRVALSLETAAETSHAFAALVVQPTSAATPTNLHGRKCHAAQCMCPDAGAMGRLDSREGAGGDACITV